MIKAIIFDNFGVLMGETYGSLKDSFPKFSDQIDSLNVQCDLNIISNEEREEKLVELIGDRAFIEYKINRAKKNYRLFNEILSLRKKYKTGILSATNKNFWNYYSQNELDKYFDDIVLSYQVGITKPNPKIFHLAAERLDVKPNECVFIDDNQINIDAANKVGMHGILYTDFNIVKKRLYEILKDENTP